VRELVLDGRNWNASDDVYDSFKAVRAPEWRGSNFNARIDSIETGRINEIGVPYRLIITHRGAGGKGEKKMVSGFVDLIPEMKARGCRVNIVIQD